MYHSSSSQHHFLGLVRRDRVQQYLPLAFPRIATEGGVHLLPPRHTEIFSRPDQRARRKRATEMDTNGTVEGSTTMKVDPKLVETMAGGGGTSRTSVYALPLARIAWFCRSCHWPMRVVATGKEALAGYILRSKAPERTYRVYGGWKFWVLLSLGCFAYLACREAQLLLLSLLLCLLRGSYRCSVSGRVWKGRGKWARIRDTLCACHGGVYLLSEHRRYTPPVSSNHATEPSTYHTTRISTLINCSLLLCDSSGRLSAAIHDEHPKYIPASDMSGVLRQHFHPWMQNSKLPSFALNDSNLLGFSVKLSALHPWQHTVPVFGTSLGILDRHAHAFY